MTLVSAQLIDRFTSVVGSEHVLTGASDTAAYTTDWTRRFHGPCTAVVRPADADQVAQIVRACQEHGVALIPQGGNTGLVGGSVPGPSSVGHAPVVLSLQRLRQLESVDVAASQVTVQAGVTIAELRRHAAAAGLEYGVDLASRDSATVGGTIATNAGGVRVCAFGTTRAQVLGIQAVLADGGLIEQLGGLIKDNSGYDLAGLVTGSEGTLAIVTAARLLLHPQPRSGVVVLVGVSSYDGALALVGQVRRAQLRLLAAEVIDAEGTRLVCEVGGLPWPLARTDHAHLVLLEVEETSDSTAVEEMGSLLSRQEANVDAVVAVGATDRSRLWSYRERQTEAVSTLGVVHKLDVSVPAGRLQEFADGIRSVLTPHPDVARVIVFGHLAEANLHIELVGPSAQDDRVDAAVLRWAAQCGGSVSAEHGIGRAKTTYLSLCRSANDLAAMASVKAALDPVGILNPGVIFA